MTIYIRTYTLTAVFKDLVNDMRPYKLHISAIDDAASGRRGDTQFLTTRDEAVWLAPVAR